MKRLCLCPGNNPKNELWLTSLTHVFSEHGWEVVSCRYAHWEDLGEFNRTREVARFRERFPQGLAVDTIIAKSAGISVSRELLEQSLITTTSYIVCGIPLGHMSSDDAKAAKERFLNLASHMTVTLVQQSNDKYGSFASVASVFGDKGGLSLIEIPGEDHWYGDADLLLTLAEGGRKHL